MNHIASIEEFNSNTSKGVCVVKFGAEWCGPCKLMEKTFSKLDAEFDAITFLTVDIDGFSDVAKQFQVKSIPTFVILKDGAEIQRIIGTTLIEPFRSALKSSLV
jgi:thioredoxin 1